MQIRAQPAQFCENPSQNFQKILKGVRMWNSEKTPVGSIFSMGGGGDRKKAWTLTPQMWVHTYAGERK